MTAFLCILQNQVFKVPEDERIGWLVCFPFFFFFTANSLHPESLEFSTVCFSWELKFSSTFRKHELHKQGAFLALLLGSLQVLVRNCTKAEKPHIVACGSCLYSVSLSHCPVPPSLGYTLPLLSFFFKPVLN